MIEFAEMEREELLKYLDFVMWHYRVVDAFWYLSLEESYDSGTADQFNEKVWNQAARIAARKIVKNFGIQESSRFSRRTREVFPGCPTVKDGYMYVNEAPGFGVDIDEKLAAKFPLPEHPGYWSPVRRSDGTAVRP